jgi:hypothetical protein
MLIEEQELRFASQLPLRAWRLFRVRQDGNGLVLSSPMLHDDTTGLTPLWPSVEAQATCQTGHDAPAAGCRCGIYGAVSGTLDSLSGYLCDTAYEQDPWAFGEIACYGRVFVDMRGVRAERAKLLRLALPEDGWPAMPTLDEAVQVLSHRYRVAVGGMDLVPQWVTANERQQGGPPEDADFHLDLGRLGMSGHCGPEPGIQSGNG